MHTEEGDSRSVVSDSLCLQGLPTRLLGPWDFPGKNTREGSHSLLKGIFSTQEPNSGLWLCRQILSCLILQGHSKHSGRVTGLLSYVESKGRNSVARG